MKREVKGNIVDVIKRKIFPGRLEIQDDKIIAVEELGESFHSYLIPGFVDAHVHIESSMLTPVEFSRAIIKRGTVGVVSDPHEIANVLGMQGVDFMIQNSRESPLKISFGAPSCVPATSFETSGASIDERDIQTLLQYPEVRYLSEVMNYPGVISGEESLEKKLSVARNLGIPIDGHAPGLVGSNLQKYISAGISTDHECFSIEEAREKINAGMMIQIREGSGAKNFEELIPLLAEFPDQVMFCSDDLHPDDLIVGHINLLVRKALMMGYDFIDVLRAASYNAIHHYNLPVGLLQPGDYADFVRIDSIDRLNILKVDINGKEIYDGNLVKVPSASTSTVNRFYAKEVSEREFQVQPEGTHVQVIRAIDGELITRKETAIATVRDGNVISDVERDILKLTVVNRYQPAAPATAFIHGFGLKRGAMASSIAHDSHNIICVGVDDNDIAHAVNWVIAQKGGIVYSDGEKEIGLPLPIAGIITNEQAEVAARQYTEATIAVKQSGSTLKSPFMTLAFMALLVIPELKLSDRGLFDGKEFKFVPLFVT